MTMQSSGLLKRLTQGSLVKQILARPGFGYSAGADLKTGG